VAARPESDAGGIRIRIEVAGIQPGKGASRGHSLELAFVLVIKLPVGQVSGPPDPPERLGCEDIGDQTGAGGGNQTAPAERGLRDGMPQQLSAQRSA
jgi:hypothetical protein